MACKVDYTSCETDYTSGDIFLYNAALSAVPP